MLKFLFRIAASSFPLFSLRPGVILKTNPPLSFTDTWGCKVDESKDPQGLNKFIK
jgi:hypothetical protein